jgi:hypothetical protein
LERILAEDWVRRRYQISDVDGSTLEPHGVVAVASSHARSGALPPAEPEGPQALVG